MTEQELQKNVAEDLKAVLEKARSMGCTEVKAFRNIPLKNVAVVVDALEKQIAKKPIVKQWCSAKCPCCDADLSESIGDGYYRHCTFLSFCDKCGQCLNWEDSEV